MESILIVSIGNIPAPVAKRRIATQYLWTVRRHWAFAWNVHASERALVKIVSGW